MSRFSYFQKVGKTDKLHFDRRSRDFRCQGEKYAVRGKVFIVTDDTNFSEMLLRNWHEMKPAPDFEVLGSGAGEALPRTAVAVLDGPDALPLLSEGVALAIIVGGKNAAAMAEVAAQRAVWLKRGEGWAEAAAALAWESALRAEAQSQAEDAELRLQQAAHLCATGKSIALARHELANALTVVLGHSEMLLMDVEMPAEVRSQVEIIYTAARRTDDILEQVSTLGWHATENEEEAQASGADVVEGNEFEVHRA